MNEDTIERLLEQVGKRAGERVVAGRRDRSATQIVIVGDQVFEQLVELTTMAEWLAKAKGSPRAVVRGPDGDELGHLTVSCTVDPGAGEPAYFAIPMLPAYRRVPQRIFAPVYECDDRNDIAASWRAAFERGLPEAARSSEPSATRKLMRVEYLGPRVYRAPNWLYFTRANGVYRQVPRQPGDPPSPAEQVLDYDLPNMEAWHYFVDLGGELARIPAYQTALLARYMAGNPDERAELVAD